MTAVKKRLDAVGATTSWAWSGPPKTFSLYIAVAGPTLTAENQAFVDAVNRKEFGALSAGFAQIEAGN